MSFSVRGWRWALLAALFGSVACAGDGQVGADGDADIRVEVESEVVASEVAEGDGETGDGDDDGDGETGDVEDDDGEVVPQGPVRQVGIEVEESDWARIHADPEALIEGPCVVVIDGERVPDSAIELHGGYGRVVDKKSYRVVMPDEADVELDLFGDGEERQRRFVLKASWIDRSFLREWLTMRLVRGEGGLAPRIGFAEVTVNGQWHGLYLLVERIDRPYLERNGLESEAVQLYKAENHNANWEDKADPLAGYDVQLGDVSNVEGLAALLRAVTRTATTEEAFRLEVEPRVSLEDFLVWQRVHTFAGNRDTFTKNYYLYQDLTADVGTPDARFRIVSWDGDAVFGIEWEGSRLPGDQRDWHGSDRFSPRLFSIATWKAQHREAYQAALDERWAVETLASWVESEAQSIRAVARRDLSKWQPDLDFDEEVERLIEVIEKRHTIMTEVMERL